MKDTIERRLRSLNNQARASGFSKLHFASSHSVFAGVRVIVPSVPAESHRPGSASSGASAVPTAVHGTNSRTIRAIGGADRPLSRFTSGANTGGIDVPRTGGRRRPLGARALRFDGRGFSTSRGRAGLGPERQSTYRLSLRPRQHGQKPLVDLIARRCLLQPGTGGDERRSSDAPPCARSGQSQLHAATKRNDGRFRH